MRWILVVVLGLTVVSLAASFTVPTCPPVSPATGLENRFYEWKEATKIRYQTAGYTGKPLVLVHGLFVNSDHWRKSLRELSDAGYTVYALDLFGCGYSDKPPAFSQAAQRCNGEAVRFGTAPAIKSSVTLGSANGQQERVRDVDQRHPLRSPYNFFTWADLVSDFTRDVVLPNTPHDEATIICNSIGTITSFQAVIDNPELFDGVFVVAPNFRELHSAEVPASTLVMPLIQQVQRVLRERGQGLFDILAKPNIVKEILNEPYAVQSAVDDTLVKVLLDPLLTDGASDIVFDTLSYSAGPLPEQQLQEFPDNKRVWICYGDQDPWTPGARVQTMLDLEPVERVVELNNVGHCPHDEAPEQVHPLILEFLDALSDKAPQSA